MSKELTDTQKKVLDCLFNETKGNLKEAAKKILGTESYQTILDDNFTNAIKRRADQEVSVNAAKAVFILSEILSNPDSVPFSDKIAKICGDILDRSGISKREREGNAQTLMGVVFLPSKQPLPEPPMITLDAATSSLPQLRAPLEITNGIQS